MPHFPDETFALKDIHFSFTEFGWFHLLVLFVCGSTFLSVTLVPNVLTYMSDDVGCDLGLSLQDKSTTNDLTYTGMVAGTFICGILADLFGRRTTLIGILLVNSLSSMCTSMVNKATSFEICRFFSSFSTSGSMVVAITYQAELHPPHNRGAAICCMQIFWVLGTIVFQAMFLSWRFLVALSAVPPILLVLVIVTFLPESPRYLLTRGKVRSTLKALQTIFAMNTGMQREKYPVKVMKDNDNLEEMRYYMEETLIPAYMKPRCYCIPILLMSQFCLMFGYYTLSLWFPELVTRHEMFFHVPHGMQSAPPNCMLGASPAYLGQHPLLILPRANSSDEVQLADDNPCLRGGGNLIYIRMLLVAFTCLPATVWLILHVDILGRKFFVVLSHVLAGSLTFGSYFVQWTPVELLFTCVYQAMCCLSIACSHCLAVEIFPTSCRATGVALVLGFSQLGVILGDLALVLQLNISCVFLETILALFIIVSGILVQALPDTVGMSLR